MKVAVFSDIHGNIEALEQVVEAFPEVDALWCLGDIVGYGAGPVECIALLSSLPLPLTIAAGNHDLGAAGLLSLETFNPEGRAAILWTRPLLSRTDLAWLKRDVRLETAGDMVTMVHASPRDPAWEYITSEEIAEACFGAFDTPICFFGHTHRPMIYAKKNEEPCRRFLPAPGVGIALRELGDRWLINPGSIGQPRDNDPRAAFIIFDLAQMSVIWQRVEYPFELAAKKIREAGLPIVLADRLALGI